ncbi:hypothetical protein ACFWNT_03520 [Streptomyces sp. NPDC058409]|uniref:hypothetical protein n=1 Tax=Streptomyces sp. NPDC058409 TaxID=3346484 RepID=UPI003646C3E1
MKQPVVGLVHLPGPADQVLAVEAQNPRPPRGADPRPGEGLWVVTDLLSLQKDVLDLLGDARSQAVSAARPAAL